MQTSPPPVQEPERRGECRYNIGKCSEGRISEYELQVKVRLSIEKQPFDHLLIVSISLQGGRIQLNSCDVEWAQQALINLNKAQDASGIVAATMLETMGPELQIKAVGACASVEFEEGSRVTLTRDASRELCARFVPVHCEIPFSSLRLRHNAQLRISTFLAAGAVLFVYLRSPRPAR
jgi:hypothetical protein